MPSDGELSVGADGPIDLPLVSRCLETVRSYRQTAGVRRPSRSSPPVGIGTNLVDDALRLRVTLRGSRETRAIEQCQRWHRRCAPGKSTTLRQLRHRLRRRCCLRTRCRSCLCTRSRLCLSPFAQRCSPAHARWVHSPGKAHTPHLSLQQISSRRQVLTPQVTFSVSSFAGSARSSVVGPEEAPAPVTPSLAGGLGDSGSGSPGASVAEAFGRSVRAPQLVANVSATAKRTRRAEGAQPGA